MFILFFQAVPKSPVSRELEFCIKKQDFNVLFLPTAKEVILGKYS